MNDRTYLAPGSTGWKAKQKIAEMKQTAGQSKEEKQRVSEARRLNRLREEDAARRARLGLNQEKTETSEQKQNESPEPDPNGADQAPPEMSREEMIAKLKAAGEKVHPASKDETLRAKVEALQ